MADTQTRLGYVPALDGLRAVAILLVVLYHSVNIPTGGFIGVDIFFALSGFLITTLLLEEKARTRSISVRKFYARRLLRLFPALVALLGAYVCVAILLGQEDRGLRLSGVGYSLSYLSNWVLAFEIDFPISELGHLWSLGVEEQFYLLWPPVLIALLARGDSRRALVGVAVIIVVLMAWRLFLGIRGASSPRLYFGTDMRIDEILIGCGFALAWHQRRGGESIVRKLMWPAVVVLAVMAAVLPLQTPFGGHNYVKYLGLLSLVALATSVVVVSVVADPEGFLARLLANKMLVFVGSISYSLYLWHILVITYIGSYAPEPLRGVGAEITIPLSFIAAVGSFYLVERPFLKLKHRFSATKTDAKAV